MMNREARMNAVKAMGLHADDMFDVMLTNIPNGSDVKIVVDGQEFTPEELVRKGGMEFDPIIQKVQDGGYIKNAHLFRRWIMAQTCRMMRYKSYDGCQKGYDAALRAMPYKYQFDMLDRELHTLATLERKDKEAFEERKNFFTFEVVQSMLHDYRAKVDKAFAYEAIGYDTYCITYKLVSQLIFDIKELDTYRDYYDLYHAYYNKGVFLKLDKYRYVAKSGVFNDAYKAEGGYYSLKNGIMFHDMKYIDGDMNDNLQYLKSKLHTYSVAGTLWKFEKDFEEVCEKMHFNLADSIRRHEVEDMR